MSKKIKKYNFINRSGQLGVVLSLVLYLLMYVFFPEKLLKDWVLKDPFAFHAGQFFLLGWLIVFFIVGFWWDIQAIEDEKLIWISGFGPFTTSVREFSFDNVKYVTFGEKEVHFLVKDTNLDLNVFISIKKPDIDIEYISNTFKNKIVSFEEMQNLVKEYIIKKKKMP